jgi:amino-acid N-acetyltransferase
MATSVRAATPEDWPVIERLLTAAGLPLAGARDHLLHFVVAEDGGQILGCAALERYGIDALLRSVAVDRTHRGEGVGEQLVQELVQRAAREGLRSIALLTTSAGEWFPRFGFRSVERADLPEAMNASEELRGACPQSATVMVLPLPAPRGA